MSTEELEAIYGPGKVPQPGDRITITGRMPDDPDPLPIGYTGTVESVNRYQIAVTWDAGDRSLCVLPGDPYRIKRQEVDADA